MTCASCVNRIERFLGKTPGVETATVNLATETATIRYQPDRADRAALVGAIEAAGYDVRTRPAPADPAAPPSLAAELAEDDLERARSARGLLLRALASIAVAAGIMVVMFLPQTAVPVTALNRLVLIPATFIQFWAGGRFYRAAVAGGASRDDQHGHARRGRDHGRLGLQRRGRSVAGPRRVGRRRARHLLRFLDDHHRPRPARALARSACQGPDDRRDPSAGRPQSGDRARRA